MARIRTALAAAPLAVALLLCGAGAAAADNGAFADHGSNGTTQTAIGSGASNASNSLAANGNHGSIYSSQVNQKIVFAPVIGAFWL